MPCWPYSGLFFVCLGVTLDSAKHPLLPLRELFDPRGRILRNTHLDLLTLPRNPMNEGDSISKQHQRSG